MIETWQDSSRVLNTLEYKIIGFACNESKTSIQNKISWVRSR
jgi:hypothetical protein